MLILHGDLFFGRYFSQEMTIGCQVFFVRDRHKSELTLFIQSVVEQWTKKKHNKQPYFEHVD